MAIAVAWEVKEQTKPKQQQDIIMDTFSCPLCDFKGFIWDKHIINSLSFNFLKWNLPVDHLDYFLQGLFLTKESKLYRKLAKSP